MAHGLQWVRGQVLMKHMDVFCYVVWQILSPAVLCGLFFFFTYSDFPKRIENSSYIPCRENQVWQLRPMTGWPVIIIVIFILSWHCVSRQIILFLFFFFFNCLWLTMTEINISFPLINWCPIKSLYQLQTCKIYHRLFMMLCMLGGFQNALDFEGEKFEPQPILF